MRLLFIGGTSFVGRAMAAAAYGAGHDVTLLHRGKTGTDVLPKALHLLADRNADLSVLAHEEWDATIDVSAYVPRQVESLAKALDGRGGHHIFISTVSVYADPGGPGSDEDAELVHPPSPEIETVTDETYGGLKVACELAARRAYGDEHLTIVRPTYVVGPHDPTGRFPWWILRMARGGRVLAPGPQAAPMQVIDARDMGAWTIGLAERKQSGVFTAARPSLGFGDLLSTTASSVGPEGTALEWVDPDWLVEKSLTGMNLPLWTEGRSWWSLAMDTSRATEAGLVHRPIEDTVRDTLAWAATVGEDHVLNRAWGISAAHESQLLAEWDIHQTKQ